MLGSRIALLRRSAGWSQTELARKIGVSPSAVGMYEQGRREPSAEILVQLAGLFGVSTDYLLTGQPKNPQEAAVGQAAIQRNLPEVDLRLRGRDARPFTREELTVLFAALLMDG